MTSNSVIEKSNPKKLNYLLVMPRFVSNSVDGYGFPLGIAYVSSCMKKAGYRVSTLNLNHCEGGLFDILKSRIEKDRFNVIMTGGLSAEYSMVRSIIETVKQINEDIITVVGGGVMTSAPKVAMDALEFVDIGVIGEGEVTSIELCHALENRGNLALIDGLIFKRSNRICGNFLPIPNEQSVQEDDAYLITNRRKEVENIDSIPWPDYEGFELEKNLAAALGTFGFNETNALSMITSRSCPYNCTFCFHTVGKKYRQRSLNAFFEELDFIVSKYRIRSLALSDELFARDASRLKEFCSRMKGYNIKWFGNFRVDDIVPEMLPLLKEGNCVTMGFGLESADNRILKSMRKGITIEQIERTLKLVHGAGISISAGFIFGDIEETLETANNTLGWWKNHFEYNIVLRLITPYPGSHIYKYACEKGVIKDQVKYLRDGCPQINTSRMTDEEFQGFTRHMMKTVLSNAKVLSSYDLSNINDTSGCVDIKGACSSCGVINHWRKVRLFKPTFIVCEKCGQQFNPPLDSKIRSNISMNLTRLLNEYRKIAVWGMTYHAIDVFSNCTILQNKNIYPVDICNSRQGENFNGRQVFSPDIIAQEGVELVIVTAPNHIGYIKAQIGTNYKNVKKVISVSNLIGEGSGCSVLEC